MSSDEKKVTISFTHISEDVIMPSGQLKHEAGLKFSCIVTFGFFGIIWLFILFAAGFRDSFTWVAFVVLLGIATISELLSQWKLYPWIEVDRKAGVINGWSNNKKRKLISSYKQNDIKTTYERILYNYKGGCSSYWLFVFNSNNNKSKKLPLFILPDKTSEPQARALTESVETFLKDFLGGKELKPSNQEYRFNLPLY